MRPRTHLHLTWTENSPRTSPTSGQTERTALSAQFSFRYSTIFNSVLFIRLPPPPEGEISGERRWQQSRALHSGNKLSLPSWAVIRVGGVSLDPSSHIRIISQLLQTRRMKQLLSSSEIWRKKNQKKKKPWILGCQPQRLANAYTRSQNTFTCLPTTLPR